MCSVRSLRSLPHIVFIGFAFSPFHLYISLVNNTSLSPQLREVEFVYPLRAVRSRIRAKSHKILFRIVFCHVDDRKVLRCDFTVPLIQCVHNMTRVSSYTRPPLLEIPPQ